MIKYTLVVEGMQCSMCESHVNNAVRKAFPVKKVQSSHSKGQTIVIAEEPLDEQQLRDAIDARVYLVQHGQRTLRKERPVLLLAEMRKTRSSPALSRFGCQGAARSRTFSCHTPVRRGRFRCRSAPAPSHMPKTYRIS